ADADPQRLGYIVDQRAIEDHHALGHVLSGGERLAAARFDAAVETKQRHHPIADELVDAPACGLDRMAGFGKVSIEEEYQIVRQLLFGELGEGSQIAEQDHDLALGAMEIARTAESAPTLARRIHTHPHPP